MASVERNFYHPYQPYDIQKTFMTAVYDCIEQGKVGIFESPTGTGKSLSLICGAMTWLRDHKRSVFEDGLVVSADDDEPDWMLEHAQRERQREAVQRRQELEERLAQIRRKEEKLKQQEANRERKYKKARTDSDVASGKDEAQFELDEYESDGETGSKATSHTSNDYGVSSKTRELLAKLGMPLGKVLEEEDRDVTDELKVYYCSRTHSQLSQFAGELLKVRIPSRTTPDKQPELQRTNSEDQVIEEFKYLTLGSRKNLCINPTVNRLGTTTAMNEKCLDLQQATTLSDCKCPYLPKPEHQSLVNDFRDHVLAKVRDIEDVASVGSRLGICPYYASRSTVKPSEIVSLPYPLMLQKSVREALGISLKDHVVIIDEAHNLMDAISNIHSTSVSLLQLQRSRAQIMAYLQRFRNRLKGKNRVYVTQTVRIVDSLIGFLTTKETDISTRDGTVQVADLLTGKGVDQINLFKLVRYLQESKLARKVEGYVVHAERQQQSSSKIVTVPVLIHVQNFLLALMNPSSEGRFFFSKTEGDESICLKYMLLDPAMHFQDIVEEARAVILAGGTMSPMSDYTEYLFPYLPRSRIMTLSCGHVIPADSLMVRAISHSTNGRELEFSFEKRTTEDVVLGLGKSIIEFAGSVPDGMVVFFPSYSYLDLVTSKWKTSKAEPLRTLSIWDALGTHKEVFVESKTQPADDILSAYAASVRGSSVDTSDRKGAILLAVIGGSLSEGINFSDELGRAVAVVGLPFPNPNTAEWKAKLAHIERSHSGGAAGGGKAAAREFYENVCMRAVNQSIGRAIRHRGDYAAILLLDKRYQTPRIQEKLPAWIKGSLPQGRGLNAGGNDVARDLRGFFANKTR